jgi:hypothetical protein
MLASRPVAGFAGLPLPASARTGFYRVVRVLLKRDEDILVTGLAGLGPDIRGSGVRRSLLVFRRRGLLLL